MSHDLRDPLYVVYVDMAKYQTHTYGDGEWSGVESDRRGACADAENVYYIVN